MPNARIVLLCAAALLAGAAPPVAAQQVLALTDLLELGFRHNPGLAAAEAGAAAQRAEWQDQRRLPNPALSFEHGTGMPGSGAANVSVGGIGITQPIENPLRRHHRVQAANMDWQAASAVFAGERIDLAYRITEAFHQILLLQERIALFERRQASLEETHALIAARARLGEAMPLDEIRLRVESLQARNQALDMRTELDQLRRGLANLLGGELPAEFRLGNAAEFRDERVDRAVLLETMRQRHPLLDAARFGLEAERSRLGELRWARLPDPAIGAAWRQEMHGKIRSIGISFELPLWNFGSRQIESASQQVRRRGLELEALHLALDAEILDHCDRLERAAAKLRLFQDGLLLQAQESMAVADAAYRHGEISLVELLDTQRGFIGIQLDHQDALYRWRMERAALERASGGIPS